MADKHYSANGFDYTVSDNGTITAEGDVPKTGEKCGARVEAQGKVAGDHNGHLIAASHNGVNADYNMTAQSGQLNQGAYRAVERAETNLAREDNNVHTSKTAFVSDPSGRPNSYMINDTITDTDGKTHTVNLSFANLSKEEQNEMNEYMDTELMDQFPNPDPVRETMTNEEYSHLMEETDKELPSIKDEFDFTNTVEMNYNDEFVAEAEAEFDDIVIVDDENEVCADVDNSADVDGGMDDGMDV